MCMIGWYFLFLDIWNWGCVRGHNLDFFVDGEFSSGHIGYKSGFTTAGGSEDEIALFYVFEGG